MLAYKITLPCGKAFTCITSESERDVPGAIFERFGVYPIGVEKL